MLVGIDGNEANVKERVGSNIYAYEVLWGIYRQIQKSKLKIKNYNLKFKIFLRERPREDLPPETSFWYYKLLRPRFLWTQWRLPLELYLSLEKPDIFFTPGHYAPRFSLCPLVISIMDLAFLRFPEQFKKRDLYQLINWTKYSVAKAHHIFTISEFSKKEINHFYGYPKEKITVTYPGISQNSKTLFCQASKGNQNHFLKVKNFKDKYFLYIGTLQPRKNLINLIEAFKLTIKQFNYQELKLIIAGKKGWLYEEIFKKVKELKLEDKVIFTGYVSEEEKLTLLSHALAFVYPSLYEGFGIPVLEAMSRGCPVLISRNSSLPEVGGKAAIYIENPYKIDSIKMALGKMLKLNQLERKKLIKEGFKQVKKFSWERSSQKILEVLCLLLKIKWEKN